MSPDDERELSSLYRAGAHEEPPAAIDRRLEKAARELARPSVWQRLLDSVGGRGWRLGFGAFALAVLSVSLVTLMHDEVPLSPEAGAPPVAAPPSSGAPPLAEALPSSTHAPGAPSAGQPSESTPQRGDSVAERRMPPDPSADGRRQSTAAHDRLATRDSPDHPAERRTSPERGVQQKSEEMRNEAAIPPPQIPAAVTDTPAAPSGSFKQRSSPAIASAPRAIEGQGRTAIGAVTESSTDTPDAWLARIEQLVREGREPQAVSEMYRFRRSHPGHPVPSALKRLVELSDRLPRDDAGSEPRH